MIANGLVLHRTMIREAAHGVIGTLLGISVGSIRIGLPPPDPRMGGTTHTNPTRTLSAWQNHGKQHRTLATAIHATVLFLMSGEEGERMLGVWPREVAEWGGQQDNWAITKLCAELAWSRNEIVRWDARLRRHAGALVRRHRNAILYLYIELVKHREVRGDEVTRIVRMMTQSTDKVPVARFEDGFPMSRAWCLPNARTFTMLPVRQLLARHIRPGDAVLDPFAADAKVGTRTNDIDPASAAQDHMPADKWLDKVAHERPEYDAAVLDPPYSARQVKEHYSRLGLAVTQRDTQQAVLTVVRDKVAKLIKPGGHVVSFGWNSVGMGINRGFRIVEVLLLSHGRHHYDTIVTVERKEK